MLLMLGAPSFLLTLTSIAVNIVLLRRRNEALRLAEPVILKMQETLATKEDIDRQRRFTGKVQDKIEEEIRRLYQTIDPLGKAVAALENESSTHREAIRELRNK
jgi:hypothetical protein